MPCNIVASDDGIITRIDAARGNVCVKVGDTVAKGQLLVSGAVPQTNGGTQFVKSSAKITANVNKTFTAFVKFKQKKPLPDSENTTRSMLYFFGLKIPLYLGEIKGNYTVKTIKKTVSVNDRYLPVYIKTAKFSSRKYTTVTYSKSEAKVLAEKKVNEIIKRQKFKSNTVVSAGFKEYSNGIEIIKDCICAKNIVKKEKLIINTFN